MGVRTLATDVGFLEAAAEHHAVVRRDWCFNQTLLLQDSLDLGRNSLSAWRQVKLKIILDVEQPPKWRTVLTSTKLSTVFWPVTSGSGLSWMPPRVDREPGSLPLNCGPWPLRLRARYAARWVSIP